jgi:hypothetical protein
MVTCVPRTVYSTICAPDFTYWPYDVVKCTVVVGAWMKTGEEITVNNDNNKVSIYQLTIQYTFIVTQLVEALRYEAEVCVFSSRRCHCDFSLTQFFRPLCGPGVDSVFNRNEYQEYFLEGKGLEILEPQPHGTLRICPRLYSESFTFCPHLSTAIALYCYPILGQLFSTWSRVEWMSLSLPSCVLTFCV